MALVCAAIAACGPAIRVKPIGSRVDALPPPTPTPPPGAERALPPALPGGWRLSGGPADYASGSLADALGDEAARFRGTKTYASAEYANFAQRVVQVEIFAMSSPDAAAAAVSVNKPADAKKLAGDDLDEGFTAGLRAFARKGALLVRVRWFEEKDDALADAAVDVMRDALARGVQAGLAGAGVATVPPAAASPTASPAAAASASPAPSPAPH